MQTIIPPSRPARRIRTAVSSPTMNFRQPSYDCREQPEAVKLTVYVPGVEAPGVEIESRGPDLLITARKSHFVRVNWQALHLETAQRDYQLRLRLGHGLDYQGLQAEITNGVLSVVLPKRQPAEDHLSIRRVA